MVKAKFMGHKKRAWAFFVVTLLPKIEGCHVAQVYNRLLHCLPM